MPRKKKTSEDLVKIVTQSTNPGNGVTNKQVYSGQHAMIVCAHPEKGCHTHIAGKMTAPELIQMMVLLTERVEAMLIKDFDGDEDMDLSYIVHRIRTETSNAPGNQTWH